MIDSGAGKLQAEAELESSKQLSYTAGSVAGLAQTAQGTGVRCRKERWSLHELLPCLEAV